MIDEQRLARRRAFARRVWEAYQEAVKADRSMTQGRFGALVAREAGERPVAQATVSRWMSEEVEDVTIPGLPIIWGIAKVTGFHPGWLAWGIEPKRLPQELERPEGYNAEREAEMTRLADALRAHDAHMRRQAKKGRRRRTG